MSYLRGLRGIKLPGPAEAEMGYRATGLSQDCIAQLLPFHRMAEQQGGTLTDEQSKEFADTLKGSACANPVANPNGTQPAPNGSVNLNVDASGLQWLGIAGVAVTLLVLYWILD